MTLNMPPGNQYLSPYRTQRQNCIESKAIEWYMKPKNNPTPIWIFHAYSICICHLLSHIWYAIILLLAIWKPICQFGIVWTCLVGNQPPQSRYSGGNSSHVICLNLSLPSSRLSVNIIRFSHIRPSCALSIWLLSLFLQFVKMMDHMCGIPWWPAWIWDQPYI